MRWLRRKDVLDEIAPEELDWEHVEVHAGRDVGMLYRPTLNTYTIMVLAPAVDYEDHVLTLDDTAKRVLADLPAMLEQVEEELERKLPEGYGVRITEWNK